MSVFKLLSVESDAKTLKGSKLGVLTGILYLAPHTVSGYQTCPKSSAGCRESCLFTAGYAGIYPAVIQARIRKTLMFFQQRAQFLDTIVKDIEKLIKMANLKNMEPAVRLNGTSDIAWEKFSVIRDNKIFKNIFAAFPDISFYDYFKTVGRFKNSPCPDNYHLTFSLSEENDKDALDAIKRGFNVAVVLNIKAKTAKPAKWSGYDVIDGDVSDIRYNDGKGKIIALTAKGKARKDTSGFVRTVDSGFKV